MSRRIFVIALCFSVLGMTVVPSRYIPCCCKATRNIIEKSGSSAPACCVKHAGEEIAKKQRSRHACCAGTPPMTFHGDVQMGRALLASNVISAPCPKCRCIAELQIVALPGFALSEKAYRLGDIVPVVETPCLLSSTQWVESLPELGHPGIVITLQTCSFRC